jgi:pyrrolidone-carboxylate peptidase
MSHSAAPVAPAPIQAKQKAAPANGTSLSGLLQRKCACGQHTIAGGECEECRRKREGTLQRAAITAAPTPGVPPIVHDVLNSPGQPLDAGTRVFMEPRFGQDFSQVRVHTTMPERTYAKLSVNQPGDQFEQEADRVAAAVMRPQKSQDRERATALGRTPDRYDFSQVRIHRDRDANESARAINALAYTVGNDIVFGAGQYAPRTSTGQSLLAHELTHTIQQGQNRGLSHGTIMRQWDTARECASAPADKWIQKVVVNQEGIQHVNIYWSDGTVESDECSTGKGHCCVDDATPEGVACSVKESRTDGSNCTPITEGTGFPVENRVRNHRGVEFWSEFVPERAIALHDYDPLVNGSPRSHGCVRLHRGTAQKIFCGVQQRQTMVQVHGFARPKCSDPVLQDEWKEDFRAATAPAPDGETPQKREERLKQQREERRMLNAAYGRKLTEKELAGGLDALEIPRCLSTAKLPTAEEQRLMPGTRAEAHTPTVPVQILATSGFDRFLTPFTNALRSASNLRSARNVVQDNGRQLWRAATARAQASTPNNDDRPLYWARLQMALALRQWEPRFPLTEIQRQGLLDLFEQASRGMQTATFTGGADVKRILISGFDPFRLEEDIRFGNPSGAAVLALNGRRISNGGLTAEVRGVIFPVRFADFNAGIVENFFSPYLKRTNPVDMIMTISMGATGDFVVERFAGRRRIPNIPDNLRERGGTGTEPVVPPGLGPGAEFIETTLPTPAILATPGAAIPIRENTAVTEIPAGGTAPVPRPGGPTPGSSAVAGSGGNFLSNEIFYRTSRLRTETGASIPYGHLHTPELVPGGPGISPSSFETARNAIVTEIEQILTATLPTL